ncbi:hypothetical protein BB561_003949 [Smittium simulii]|uniref:NADH dehydrogenase [ubiquinone] 1 beta subcomplex subunit 9 n=1 Tax=Smittium simulii TaxID=133385 RepID=A0A2T9YIS6_9FUNG|nr:hypothetical protein BB561_003949 [Smittium simulii]
MSSAHTRYVKSLYKRSLNTALNWSVGPIHFRPVALEIRAKFEQNRHEASPIRLQEILSETEVRLEELRHPLPYRYPTAVDGTKYERNRWFEDNMVLDKNC